MSMSIGWLDFSDEERDRINRIMHALQEKSNLDELGLAPIRDGFADLFFPGISTLVNRAKYFLIVPYAIKDLEKKPYENLAMRLEHIEKQCGEKLKDGKDNYGVIGKNRLGSGGWVTQPPSAMYWGPLRNFGIFRRNDLSLSGCLQYIRDCSIPAKLRKNEYVEGISDDDDAGRGDALKLWDPGLPYDPNWLDNLQIALTPEEAKFLKGRILETAKDSLLGQILQKKITLIEECNDFLELGKIIELFPEQIRKDYQLASSFSLFTLALRTAYAMEISQDQHEEALQWLKNNRLAEYADIDLEGIFKRLDLPNNNETRKLKTFLEKAKELMRSEDMDKLKRLVNRREHDIKVIPKSGMEPVTDWSGRQALGYRFGNGRNICKDIFAGLKGNTDA